MMIKSKILFVMWIIVFVFFIVNPLFKYTGVMAYSVIELPPYLASIILVIVIPLGCLSLIDWISQLIRKLLTKRVRG
ncbi:Uncharacterised protein [Serratia fonticola]|jgi:prepilin signal peptidase PulO-like enzyme (type II secretory pathway)|nr:Uncharacterised protein [Serratia fonticola]CAI1637266.1 Uncharacterised protein [Serratia fonticola]CAI1702156.1 Uncharacterised protein [Serratia fonticola]CAI2404627.1 Uncharacterised protein [Serratia fonticola]